MQGGSRQQEIDYPLRPPKCNIISMYYIILGYVIQISIPERVWVFFSFYLFIVHTLIHVDIIANME